MLEIANALKVPAPLKATVSASAFEDNNAALTLASTTQRLTNRTRYYHCQFHHFWEHQRSGVLVAKIETSLQDADYFTKAMPRDGFDANRRRVQGLASTQT